MTGESAMDIYLSTIIAEGLYSSGDKLRFHMDSLFDGINLKGKRVLDVGGGVGMYSFYAACRGAAEVVCLEPEGEGSSSGMIETFERLNVRLACDNVELKPVTLQALAPGGDTFDVILLHDSVNHLDEGACVTLMQDPASRSAYRAIFSEIFSLAGNGARLIICDCSRRNFFARLNLRNPFVPTIEWHKHQTPEVWAQLLADVGFKNPRIRWSSFNRLGSWGKVLTSNRVAAYFLTSHFCLTMEKP